MKRRNFIASSAVLGFGLGSTGLAKALSELVESPEPSPLLESEDIDPYFLDPGIVTKRDQEKIMQFARFHEDLAAGKAGFQPRGDRQGTPSYRFLHWNADIGDSKGKFVGPLSLKPFVESAPSYQLNAQLLAFHPANDDWRHNSQGALTIEMRVPGSGDPLTWLFQNTTGGRVTTFTKTCPGPPSPSGNPVSPGCGGNSPYNSTCKNRRHYSILCDI